MVIHAHETAPERPDLAPVREVVSKSIWDAMVDASAELDRLGVRHALIGGLAVGAHGYPRATKDVDFIVDDSGWETKASGLVVMRLGLPIRAHGVDVDHLAVPIGHEHLSSAIHGAVMTEGVPVAPVEEVVYLKLLSPRPRDQQDIAELVTRGAVNAELFEDYLDQVGAPTSVRTKWSNLLRSLY